jgi:hypothetical protein
VNTWCLLYKPGICVFTFYDYDIFNFFVFLYSLMIGREELLICRALERFNRELNNCIMPSPMHILPCSSSLVRRISADEYTQYDRVAKGREQAPVHQPANLFTVPAAYFTFAYVAPIN